MKFLLPVDQEELETVKLKYCAVNFNDMITVDCRDIGSIKNELLVYVADQVAAIPSLKIHEFMLSPIEEGQKIDQAEVITVIKEFLDSIGEARNFAVIGREGLVLIKSISGKKIERETQPVEKIFSCPHCGFVTQFEIEHSNHLKIHYI